MHVIIGKGNLAMDLKIALEREGADVTIFTRSTGFDWEKHTAAVQAVEPTHIWITAGFGSVDQCAKDIKGALETHVAMPVHLAQSLPDTVSIGMFSSDYVAYQEDLSNPLKFANRPRSLYAVTKLSLELMMSALRRPNTTTFRVGSLYGTHFPDRCFPGKITSRYPSPCRVELPNNMVCPTPTRWAAETIVKNLGKCFDGRKWMAHNVAPSGRVSVADWGRSVLGPGYEVVDSGLDKARPMDSGLLCTLQEPPPWDALWQDHVSGIY